MSVRWMRVAAVLTVAVAVLAGCADEPRSSGLDLPEYRGGTAEAPEASPAADKTGPEILAEAKAALAAAEFVTLEGETTGQGTTLRADLAFAGPDGTGIYGFGAGTFAILVVDGRSWYRGDKAAYKAFGGDTDALARKIDGRWIVDGSKNRRLAQLEVAGTRAALLDDFIDGGGGETRGADVEVDGVEAVTIESESGSVVVAKDTALPLRLRLDGDEGEGIVFSYGTVAKPKPPRADRILDLADLR